MKIDTYSTHNMELQISHSICAKVQETGNIWEDKSGYRTKISVSSFMGYLKGKSSLMIFDKYANLKYRYGNREFQCRGYYVDTVGKNKRAIAGYIRNQLQEDLAYEQMSIKELVDPFTGEPVKTSKK